MTDRPVPPAPQWGPRPEDPSGTSGTWRTPPTAAVDVILGITYAVYRLGGRQRS
ncbi:hypothetical protein [Streptomyces virginiae]|uniref:hypothetical protein n=1 Tax=Streptomyces virginiae TaxID=1961 RepID=UPI0034467E4F